MNIQVIRRRLAEVESPWLVLFLNEPPAELPAEVRGTALGKLLERLVEQKEITASPAELTAIHEPGGCAAASALVIGLGAATKVQAGGAYSAGFAIAKRLAGRPKQCIAVAPPVTEDGQELAEGWIAALVAGITSGTRGPGICKGERNRHRFEDVQIILPPGTPDPAVDAIRTQALDGQVLGINVILARELTNLPPSEKSPRELARRIRKAAQEVGLGVEVWDEARIRGERFGGLLGVAAGSDNPPVFVVLDYRGGGDGPTTALVGKGVTFDSGGLSLKPSASMEDMKSDMTGAAVVAATMTALATMHAPINVTGYLALTENMTGGRAMKLGDVLTMRNGKTVEVLNTDAEGRLILADALSYAAEKAPARILDLATLTGACMVALGSKVAGLFSNDDVFADSVAAASRATGERVWRLPLDDDYKELLKSNVADLKNVGGKWGGAITAAKFLEQFVDGTPWVHLDIAGPSWSESDKASQDAGGTGCFVRTLVKFLKDKAG